MQRRGAAFTRFDGNLAGADVPSPAERTCRPPASRGGPTARSPISCETSSGSARSRTPRRSSTITPHHRGSLVHDVLERFIAECRRHRASRPGPAVDDIRPRSGCGAIAEAVFAEYEAKGLTGRPVFWHRERKRIMADLLRGPRRSTASTAVTTARGHWRPSSASGSRTPRRRGPAGPRRRPLGRVPRDWPIAWTSATTAPSTSWTTRPDSADELPRPRRGRPRSGRDPPPAPRLRPGGARAGRRSRRAGPRRVLVRLVEGQVQADRLRRDARPAGPRRRDADGDRRGHRVGRVPGLPESHQHDPVGRVPLLRPRRPRRVGSAAVLEPQVRRPGTGRVPSTWPNRPTPTTRTVRVTDVAPPDATQRDRIAGDLGSTLFVEAGAGSGKTTELVGPRARAGHDRRGRTGADRRHHLHREGGHGAPRPGARRTSNAPSSAISRPKRRSAAGSRSINSTVRPSARCTRSPSGSSSEHPIEAGLPPRVEVVDEVSSEVAFERRWRTFRDELLADARARADHRAVAAAGVRFEALRALAVAFNDNWDLVAERVPVQAPDPPDALGLLAPVLAEIDRSAPSPAGTRTTRCPGSLQPVAASTRRGCGPSTDEVDLLEALDPDGATRPPSFRPGTRGRQQSWTADPATAPSAT